MSDSTGLYKILLPVLPADAKPILKSAIEAVEALPGLKNWKPKQVNLEEAIRIVRWGLPLTFLSSSSIESLDALCRRIAHTIKKYQTPSQSDIAELEAAALCAALGAMSIMKIKTGPKKTPDFCVSWRDAGKIDLEVTCARRKPVHLQRQKIATELAQRIEIKNRNWDVILHYVDPPNPREMEVIVETSQNLKPGMEVDQKDRWHVCAEKPDRHPYTILTGGEQIEPPQWWPSGIVRLCSYYGFLAGPNASEPPPQTRVFFGVPIDAYLNPVQNKADSPQGGIDKPFVIAIDVDKLPGAFREFRQALPEYFGIWGHVSGVLAFRSWITFLSKAGWSWELIPNPNATYPLPSELLAIQVARDNHMEGWVPLREGQSG